MQGPGLTTGTAAPERFVPILDQPRRMEPRYSMKTMGGVHTMTALPRFTICTIDGDLQVSRFSESSWRVHFPGGERDDMLVCQQAVAVLTDPFVLAAVEAVIDFETGKWTDAGFTTPARPD